MTARDIFRRFTSVLTTISPIWSSKFYYRFQLHKKLNLKDPKTFNEKLMWLKHNEYVNDELVIECADKLKVRNYISKCGCEEILNELITVYDNPKDINFSDLPSNFVLKINNAAGYNVIVSDKSKISEKKVIKKFKKWWKRPYWKFHAELQYKPAETKIICEKFLDSKDGNAINDYKIYCFNGKPMFCMVCVDRNLGHTKYYFMDKKWKLMRINPAGIAAPKNFKLDKPKCIDKMYDYAEKLSKPFKFVRVDFYDYNGKTIFGELTFTPCACADKNYSEKAQIELGELIDLKM